MLRVSVAVGRSVGRGGDRYDMHAASEERSGKRRREKRRPRFSPIRKRGGHAVRGAAASHLRGGARRDWRRTAAATSVKCGIYL